MNTQINIALMRNYSAQPKEDPLNETYRPVSKNCKYLIDSQNRALCIVNQEIGVHKNPLNHVRHAQEFNKDLPLELKNLSQLNIKACNTKASQVRSANQTTPKVEQAPRRIVSGLQEASKKATSKAEIPLTQEHLKYLKKLLENQIDGTFQSDNSGLEHATKSLSLGYDQTALGISRDFQHSPRSFRPLYDSDNNKAHHKIFKTITDQDIRGLI